MWRQPPINVNKLPREPGVYRMLDGRGKVLYVGKARNLRKRVASYFQRRPDSPRTQAMATQIRDIAITVTASEAEALVLEHNLIKQLKPRYNVLLKDAKSYPYILLTDEDYPRLKLYRGNRSQPGEYFGPFPHAGAAHATVHAMQKVFRIRNCDNTVFRNRSRPCMQYQIGRCTAPCCHVVTDTAYAAQVSEARAFLKGKDRQLMKDWEQRMQTASASMDFEAAATWRDRIRTLRTILSASDASGLPDDADAIVLIRHASGVTASIGVRRSGRDLGTHMVRVEQAQQADDAEILQSLFIERYKSDQVPAEILVLASATEVAELRTLLGMLRPKARTHIKAPRRGARFIWMERIKHSGNQSIASRASANQQPAFEALAQLFGLNEAPQCIAAVDNAHLGGKQTVAAIVYADFNGPDKEHYRRYKLDDVPPGDDYAAMRRVLSRFFKAINDGSIPAPDIMLIDGGKGQLGVAMQTAADHGLSSLKLAAVAKGPSRKPGAETLWPGWRDDAFEIGASLKPGRHSPALLLIARVRDEAHRFAGSYMRKRKQKAMFRSELDAVPGVGRVKRTALLKHFGGVEGVKKASRHQLAQSPGISEKLAERIFTALHR